MATRTTRFDQWSTITQLVCLSISADNRKTIVTEVCANARESLIGPGVLRFDVLQQIDIPNLLLLHELYESPEALVAHQKTAHFKRWQELAIPLLTKPREKLLCTPLGRKEFLLQKSRAIFNRPAFL